MPFSLRIPVRNSVTVAVIVGSSSLKRCLLVIMVYHLSLPQRMVTVGPTKAKMTQF